MTETSSSVRTSALVARLDDGSAVAIGVFRIVIGVLFAMHGTAKLFGWPMGDPAVLGAWPMWWAGVLEVVLGALIVLGLFARVSAFLACGMMAFAYFYAHASDGFWPIVNGGEPAVLYCFVFLLLAIIGPGALTVARR